MRASRTFSHTRSLRQIAMAFVALVTTVFVASAPASAQSPKLTPVNGSGQSTTVNTLFPNPLSVIYQDASGNTQAGVPITFTAPGTP